MAIICTKPKRNAHRAESEFVLLGYSFVKSGLKKRRAKVSKIETDMNKSKVLVKHFLKLQNNQHYTNAQQIVNQLHLALLYLTTSNIILVTHFYSYMIPSVNHSVQFSLNCNRMKKQKILTMAKFPAINVTSVLRPVIWISIRPLTKKK